MLRLHRGTAQATGLPRLRTVSNLSLVDGGVRLVVRSSRTGRAAMYATSTCRRPNISLSPLGPRLRTTGIRRLLRCLRRTIPTTLHRGVPRRGRGDVVACLELEDG